MHILDKLRHGLIVSVQAKPGTALDDPHVLAAMAQAAQEAGAAAVRIQGVNNLKAVRARVTIPIIGLIKRDYPDFAPYITPTLKEVEAILATGAEIVALDATLRRHPNTPVPELISAIQAAKALAMADCSSEEDAKAAIAAGADIVATTLTGYTDQTKATPLPALELVRSLRQNQSSAFIICEGGIHTPDQAKSAFTAGADAIVIGTAITDINWRTTQFLKAIT